MSACTVYHNNTFTGVAAITETGNDAGDRGQLDPATGGGGGKTLKPALRPSEKKSLAPLRVVVHLLSSSEAKHSRKEGEGKGIKER